MAHVISLTDGTATITFTAANGYQVEEYDPRTPEAENGADVDSVAETLQIYITGSSGSQVQTRQAALERLLLGVRNRARSGVGRASFCNCNWTATPRHGDLSYSPTPCRPRNRRCAYGPTMSCR